MAIERITAGHMVSMNFPPKYSAARRSDLTAEQSSSATPYIDSLEEYLKSYRGFYIYGPNGSGKTYVAAIMLKKGILALNTHWYWISPFEIQEAYIKENLWDENEKITVKRHINTVQCLVIDDIGKEYRGTSGYIQTLIKVLLRRRHDYCMSTVITSNMTPEEFTSVYGETVGTLIGDYLVPVEINAADIRKQRAKGLING